MSDLYSSSYKNPYLYNQKEAEPISPLAPYVQQVQAQEKKKLNLLQPVQWIFDLLQRGQYLTANVGEEIIKSVRTGEPLGQAAKDAITGAFEGLTGQRKGTWGTVLFGGKVDKRVDEEEYNFEGLFPDTTLPSWAKKVIGFAADVVLDPTTYVSFGATSAARAGAKKYAENAMEVFLKTLSDPTNLQKVATSGVGREAAKIYRRAYREALGTVSRGGVEATEILSKNLTGQLGESLKPLTAQINALAAKSPNSKKLVRMRQAWDELRDTFAKVQPAVQYGEPGKRALKLGPLGIGKEILKHDITPVEQAPLKLWNAIKETFEKTPVGSKIGDAWYAINNTGILGNIRKMFGIRDPYQKYIRELSVDTDKIWQSVERGLFKQTYDTVHNLAPEVQEQARDAIHLADLITKGTPKAKRVIVQGSQLLKNTPQINATLINNISRYDLRKLAMERLDNLTKVTDLNQVTDAVGAIEKLTQEWEKVCNYAASIGALEDFNGKLNYLPNVYTDIAGKGKGGISTARKQVYRGIQAAGQEREYLKWLLNIDDAAADKLIKENGAGVLMTSLEDMLMYRAAAQSKIISRITVFENFRKFGIPLQELDNKLLKERFGRALPEGLKHVESKAFNDMVFPTEVADIFDKINTYTKDPGLKAIRKVWNSFTGWWKGFATISTGFHVRNGIQNELNGWMKHGMGWFNPETKAEAIAATIYALAKDNPRPLLEKAAMKMDMYQRLLAKRVGNFSVQELADVAAQKVFSRTTLGFDAADFMGKAKGFTAGQLNPMSREFVAMKGSRIVGEYLENGAKMQSFLMDYRAALGEGVEGLEQKLSKYLPIEDLKGSARYQDSDYALQWAKDETRKWFFEYDDLTEVEKKLFRNVIPFYSWMRKNIPHQLAIIFTDPSIYAILPKAERAMTGTEVDEQMIPEWMRAAGAIPFAKNKEGQPVMWIPNLGYSDLNKIPLLFGEGGLFGIGRGTQITGREVIDDIVSSAHPALKQIVQQIPEKGYDVFYRKDLDYNAKAPYLLRYFAKVPGMLNFMDGIARVIGREEGLGFVVDSEGMLRMNGKIAKLLEDNLPILRSLERVMYLGEEVIPGLDKAIESATGAKDTHEGLDRFFQVLSYWGGMKFKPVDLEQAKKDVAADLYEKATELRAKTEAYTPAAKKRQLTAEKATTTKYRRVGL